MVRPILPEDKARLTEGFRRLSPESRYKRFMAAISGLSDAQLRHFTEIDYVDHMAWVALDPSQPGLPGLGVARYIRIPHTPSMAEVAVTVVDDLHGLGLGTLLLGLITRSASENGIFTFRAYVLDTNHSMLRIFQDLGALACREDAGLLRLDIPVPADPETLPDTPTGRAFKAVAREALREVSATSPERVGSAGGSKGKGEPK